MNIYYFTLGLLVGSLVTTGAMLSYDQLKKKRAQEKKVNELSGEYDW